MFVIKFKENSQMENERNSFCWGLKSTVSRLGRVIVSEHLKNKYARFVFKVVHKKEEVCRKSSKLLTVTESDKKTQQNGHVAGKFFYITSQSGVAFYVAKETKSCVN